MTAKGNEVTVRVDVGGCRVAATVVSGGALPTVFISGRGDGHDVWVPLLPLLRSDSTTLTYDRAGIGDSDPAPTRSPRPYSELAGELMGLLQGLPLTGPFVVVAHSMGALVARSLSASHPELVAGLVLLDGSVDEVELWPADRPPADGPGSDATPLDFKRGATELAHAADPAVPAIVVTRTPGRWTDPKATEAVDQRWTAHQQAMADRLHAALLVANNSGHYVHQEAAELAALAVDAVISAVLAGQTVIKLDSAQVDPAGGWLARQGG